MGGLRVWTGGFRFFRALGFVAWGLREMGFCLSELAVLSALGFAAAGVELTGNREMK